MFRTLGHRAEKGLMNSTTAVCPIAGSSINPLFGETDESGPRLWRACPAHRLLDVISHRHDELQRRHAHVNDPPRRYCWMATIADNRNVSPGPA